MVQTLVVARPQDVDGAFRPGAPYVAGEKLGDEVAGLGIAIEAGYIGVFGLLAHR
jgi:hypothetical protein